MHLLPNEGNEAKRQAGANEDLLNETVENWLLHCEKENVRSIDIESWKALCNSDELAAEIEFILRNLTRTSSLDKRY